METIKLNVSSEQINKCVINNFIGRDIDLHAELDYSKWVIKILPLQEGNYYKFSGEILLIRDNGIFDTTNVILNLSRKWNEEWSLFNNLVISEAPYHCSLCTFIQNNKKYIGIHWFGSANPQIRLIREKIGNVNIESIVYSNTSGIINEEIANSVTNINWNGTPKI